ncbi:MAG: GNAT family N-acetyltransferase [Actinomycetota bacterium]|nr:GNAT family N-acetyltransferase [Actinomycetota bacterium]
MTDATVRPLGEDDWQEFRAIRLRSLTESPEAFAAKLAEEEALEEDFWRLRLRRSVRLVAELGGEQQGVVCLGQAHNDEGEVPEVGEIFGLWVAPEARGTGVATRLIKAASSQAAGNGKSHVAYWVGVENFRGVAFASGMGFRPTDFRREMRLPDGTDLEQIEIAMILPLGEDRGTPSHL